jgi:TolB-like protein
LSVIARNAAFAYKGQSADARSIARDLGVRCLLEGSARRAAQRVRSMSS